MYLTQVANVRVRIRRNNIRCNITLHHGIQELINTCMNNQILAKTLLETLHPRSITQQIKKHYTELYKDVVDNTKHLNQKWSFAIRLFHYANPEYLSTPVMCAKCSEQVVTLTAKGRWSEYCSAKCRGSHNSAKSREQAVQTSLNNWGVENPAQHEEIRKKMQATLNHRIGVDHALQSKDIQEQKKNTMMERHGVEHAAQSREFQEKMISSYLKNWGVSNPSLRHIPPESYDKLHNETWLDHNSETSTCQEMADLLQVSEWLVAGALKKFGIVPKKQNYYRSAAEIDIEDYIKSIRPDLTVLTSDRKLIPPYEIDIYIPELALAFEYNGLYYHSEEFGKTSKYHLMKTTRCHERGVRLIHIWENDYIKSKEVLFSKIANLLHKSVPIYARKCTIDTLSIADARAFLNSTHIQGYCNSTIKLGLRYNNEIVACMTFIPTRFSNDAEWELLRYSSKLHHNVVGGFSKLLTHFVRTQSTSIISYSDKCWSTGDVYRLNGFDHIRTSKPSYFYTKDGVNVYHRMSFQKKKMKTKLEYFDPALTESENMKNNGFIKIWNCGNDAWLFNNTS